MKQTGYKGVGSFYEELPYIGGFCKWWFIEKEKVSAFPKIDPLTQFLSAEPILVLGAAWKGPYTVLNDKLGFEEQPEKGKPGIAYKQKVSGIYAGDHTAHRIMNDNMLHHEFIVVGQLRAGGFFLVIGNTESALDYDANFNTGDGPGETAERAIAFTGLSTNAALVLENFQGVSMPPPNLGGGTVTVIQYDMELVDFNTTGDTEIEWTSILQGRFGDYPTLEMWATDATTGLKYKANFAVDVNEAVSPKRFIIRNAGGIGVIKIT